MWWAVCLLVTVRAANPVYQYDDTEQFRDYYDFYDEEEASTSTLKYFMTQDAFTRVRRYGLTEPATHNAYDIKDVKGALKQLFSGRRMENSFTFVTEQSRNYNGDDVIVNVVTRSNPYVFDGFTLLGSLESNARSPTRSEQPQKVSFSRRRDYWLPRQRAGRRQGNETTTSLSETTAITSTTSSTSSVETTTTAKTTTTTTTIASTTVSPTTVTTTIPSTTVSPTTVTTTSSSPESTTTMTNTTITTNTTTTTKLSSTRSTSPKSSTKTRFDIEALLDIVANLTYDYDTNLTLVLNETLQKFSIPTCRTPTTTVTTTTVTTTEIFYNTTVISKCFVCGLDIPGIPRNTFCSDAFATDFLPLVPIDPTAKGHIARFRKYCRYFDVNNYQLNRTDPRAMLGRWTGGCSVRWIDLSGVYTQRSCRNRLRPTTGLHFASKRMAKLELALSNVENGCIISPMATLVPLSRGISLYARFHACVCTGNWCNGAFPARRLSSNVYFLFVLIMEILK